MRARIDHPHAQAKRTKEERNVYVPCGARASASQARRDTGDHPEPRIHPFIPLIPRGPGDDRDRRDARFDRQVAALIHSTERTHPSYPFRSYMEKYEWTFAL